MATVQLTAEGFKERFFDYTQATEWQYAGERPAVIDFYADWCGPCKAVAPIMDELSNDFEGRVDIYKVDTEVERELAGIFGIRSIPSILFVPGNGGTPMMQAGALPKEAFQEIIEKELLTSSADPAE